MDDSTTPEVTAEVTYVTSTESERRVENALKAGIQRGKDATLHLLSLALQKRVDENDLEKSEARDIWTEANADDSTGNPFTTTWTVTVSLDGDEILELNEVEADSADEAESEVANNIVIEDVTVSCTIRYGRDYYNQATVDELDDSYYTVDDSAIIEALDIKAEPED